MIMDIVTDAAAVVVVAVVVVIFALWRCGDVVDGGGDVAVTASTVW